MKNTTQQFTLITEDKWKFILLKSKKKSISSIFSNRIYSMYKCALSNKRLIIFLVRFYNIIVEKQYFPTRWQKMLDVMIEKNKGPVIGKLRTIQFIEADLLNQITE